MTYCTQSTPWYLPHSLCSCIRHMWRELEFSWVKIRWKWTQDLTFCCQTTIFQWVQHWCNMTMTSLKVPPPTHCVSVRNRRQLTELYNHPSTVTQLKFTYSNVAMTTNTMCDISQPFVFFTLSALSLSACLSFHPCTIEPSPSLVFCVSVSPSVPLSVKFEAYACYRQGDGFDQREPGRVSL